METTILMAFIVLLYTLQSLFTKLYTDKYPGDPDMASQTFTTVSGLTVVVLTFFCFSHCHFTFNPWSLLIAAVNACALFAYNYFIVKSSQTGPYSVLMMFSLSGGIIMPIVFALIFGWDSWTTPFEVILNAICIVVIITSVYFVSRKKESGEGEGRKGISLAFILFCSGLALGNGVYCVILTLQQELEIAGGEANRDEMIIATYFFAFIMSVVSGIIKKRGNYIKAFRQTKASLAFLICASTVVALGINLAVIIIPMLPTTIFYTLDNSLVLLLSVICSAVFFKEKLSTINVIGIVLTCAALVAMNLLPEIVPPSWVG